MRQLNPDATAAGMAHGVNKEAPRKQTFSLNSELSFLILEPFFYFS
jgi:hypothetical protein